MKPKFCIIAGTEKAGTTSLYANLVSLKLFNESKKKETDYLRRNQVSLSEYLDEFEKKRNGDNTNYYLEASPGYLSDSEIVAKNILELNLEKNFFLFILRSPYKKLVSSFKFHKSRLNIPKSMSFEKYIEHCLEFYKTGKSDSGLSDWCLNIPKHSLYAERLECFDNINCSNLLVVEFEYYIKNEDAVINQILKRCHINKKLSKIDLLPPSNITRQYRFDLIQRIALIVNKKLESFFYKHKKLKESLLKLYFIFNSGKDEKVILNKETMKELRFFFENDIRKLGEYGFLKESTLDAWIRDFS